MTTTHANPEHGQVTELQARLDAATQEGLEQRRLAESRLERITRHEQLISALETFVIRFVSELKNEAEERDWCGDYEEFVHDDMLPHLVGPLQYMYGRVEEAAERNIMITLTREDEMTITVNRSIEIAVPTRDYESGNLDEEELWAEHSGDDDPSDDDIVRALRYNDANCESTSYSYEAS